jgi:chromosomal replication initiator protein
MPVKDALRAHLALLCTEEELCSWYDPLHVEIDQEAHCLMVTFPHHLFAPWFANTGRESLEICLASCLGRDIPVRYVTRPHQAKPIAPSSTFPVSRARMEKGFGDSFALENFLINKKNFFPLAVAREVVKKQHEPSYNPLVYYGKSGSGKTHLLRAIANELSKTGDRRAAVFYGNASQLIQAYEQRAQGVSSNAYRAYCVDDIHLLANNFPWQEQLMLLLDGCLDSKTLFVCACSESLASHRGLAESLRSRLELGLIVELKRTDMDVRMRFAQAQCLLHGIDITREHLLLLAQRCEHLRYLTGVLLKIAAYKNLTQRAITTRDIEKILRNSGEHSPVTSEDIIRRVAEYFSLPPEDILRNTRKPTPVFARQMAMYLCREILGLSYPGIGQIFGGKDHSTVMHAIKKIEKYIVEHKNMHMEILELKKLCFQKYD